MTPGRVAREAPEPSQNLVGAMQTSMLAPAAALVLWSLIILQWLAISRFSAVAKAGIDLKASPPGTRGQALEGVLPDRVMWKSHNYSHLMEQPTLFYPTVFIIAALGGSPLDIGLAWAYTASRVLHSLWQVLVNTIPVRIALFTCSTFILLALAVRACLLAWGLSS